MASAKSAGIVWLLVLVAMSSSSLLHVVVGAKDHCLEDKNKVMKHCWSNIERKHGDKFAKGTSECCKVLKASVDVPCICGAFTQEDLAKISLEKWDTVTHMCDKGLPQGYDCAGYIVPDIYDRI